MKDHLSGYVEDKLEAGRKVELIRIEINIVHMEIEGSKQIIQNQNG